MKQLYCVICGKYRKSEKSKTSCLLDKTVSSFKKPFFWGKTFLRATKCR